MTREQLRMFDIEQRREYTQHASFNVYSLHLKEYGQNKPLGYKVVVIFDKYNFGGHYREEWLDFIEEREYRNVVDEMCEKHGTNARIWVVLTEIAVRA